MFPSLTYRLPNIEIIGYMVDFLTSLAGYSISSGKEKPIDVLTFIYNLYLVDISCYSTQNKTQIFLK